MDESDRGMINHQSEPEPPAPPPGPGRSASAPTGPPFMAKKKAAAKLNKTWKSKPVAFQVRGTPEYKKALERLAAADGKSLASLADHAIRLYARTINFAEAIPKR